MKVDLVGDTVVGRSTGDLGLVSFSRRSLYTEFVGNFYVHL